MYTKYTYSYYSMYLHYRTRFTKSVNCIRFPMRSYINSENCAGLPCVCIKLFNFEIQILCAHKPYFLMPGHVYSCIAYTNTVCSFKPHSSIYTYTKSPHIAWIIIIHMYLIFGEQAVNTTVTVQPDTATLYHVLLITSDLLL